MNVEPCVGTDIWFWSGVLRPIFGYGAVGWDGELSMERWVMTES